jgi:hypothetical protein
MKIFKKLSLLVGLTGIFSTLIGAILLFFVGSKVGVSVWEYNLAYLFFYTLLVSSSLAINRHIPLFGFKQIATLGVLFLLGFVISIGSPIGFVAIGLVILMVYISSALLCKTPISLTYHFIQCIIITSLVGSVWVVTTAPIYAEGFVLLAWVVFAIQNLFVLIVFYFTSRFLNNTHKVTCKLPNNAAALGTYLLLLFFSAGISFSSLYFMILVEGAPQEPLVRDQSWEDAFFPITNNVAFSQNKALPNQVSKQQFIETLNKQKSLSMSQLATLFFLTGNDSWAEKFKSQLVNEAVNNKYTGKTGSIKFSQREVMVRAMYLLEIQKQVPNFLTEAEQKQLTLWFENIAARIMSPEWVDYLYAVPFHDEPDGPYLNQEIGAGAVAVLLHFIKDEKLTSRIEHFLKYKASGFLKNYRNPDDSMEYHDVWVENAFVMHRYYNNSPETLMGMKLAIKWLMSQLPQHPVPLEYGLPHNHRPLNTLAIAAFYLKNKQAKWLLEKHLIRLSEANEALESTLISFWLWDDAVQPEKTVFESMILDGPTGYAFRPGPLAPDKVILRDIAENTLDESTYLIANLRNIGWHRYPATNTAIRIMFDGDSIAGENIIKRKHNWLPAGRATHRDKKIDRIRLNGLQIARDGLDGLIGGITGVYSQWRQDVPRTAKVVASGFNNSLQSVTVLLENWHDTDHYRTYLLLDERQLLVIDEIRTRKTRLPKLISWHLQSDFEPITDSLFENNKYAVAFSVPASISQKNETEISAYDEFKSDRLVSLDLKNTAREVLVTAFSEKSARITNLKISEKSVGSHRYEVSYAVNSTHKKLIMNDSFEWQKVEN